MSNFPQKSKSRLGRGLSSLISVSELPVEAEIAPIEDLALQKAPQENGNLVGGPNPAEIAPDLISPNPHQPRHEMDETSLTELAASIKSTGLIQPIIVRKVDSGYQLIAGERRLRAAKIAGLKTIPAIVREVDSFSQAQMALVENIQREDLNPIDRAQAYRALATQLGLTQQELASRLGEDRSSIANFMRLLELAEPVRELVRVGKISLGHAKLLAGIDDTIEQQRIAELCLSQELSVRNLERLLASYEAENSTSREKGVSPHLADLEKTIARQLGMRVQVRSNKSGRGRLVVHYASLDQFDELMQRMNVKTE
jgi:ParB family chromosome partitioning protein